MAQPATAGATGGATGGATNAPGTTSAGPRGLSSLQSSRQAYHEGSVRHKLEEELEEGQDLILYKVDDADGAGKKLLHFKPANDGTRFAGKVASTIEVTDARYLEAVRAKYNAEKTPQVLPSAHNAHSAACEVCSRVCSRVFSRTCTRRVSGSSPSGQKGCVTQQRSGLMRRRTTRGRTTVSNMHSAGSEPVSSGYPSTPTASCRSGSSRSVSSTRARTARPAAAA